MSWKHSCKKLPRNVMDWEQPLHFKWQTSTRASSKALRGRGNEELSPSFPDLVTVSCFACHSHVTSLRHRTACSQAAMVFIFVRDCCIVITMADSIPSVPIPPKAFVKYWHLLWLSTSEQEWTKLLKLSSLAKKICLKDTLLAESLRSFC